MITTTYTCDRCKQNKQQEELYEIKLSGHAIAQPRHNWNITPLCGPAHICVDCLRTVGWFRIDPKPAEPVPTPPTLEDLITTLVIETVQEHLPS